MVNYILSFCKITAASRIFARHFYLPLLKPVTPKQALRTFRITGKWLLGAKIQHYIPVLLNHTKKRSKKVKDYGEKVHEEMPDFNYMTPVIDPENENHRILAAVLETKKGEGVFVYTVEDKKYNIVLQAQFEVAIRDGDIIDLLVSQKNDKIIVKLKDFKKIPMEIQYYEGDKELYHGEGATTPAEEEFHHHGKYTMSLAKIFEDKERLEEEWEEHLRRMIKRRKKHKAEGTREWKDMVKESMKNLDWQKFEEDAKKVIDEISQPAVEQDIEMDVDDLEKTKNVNETIMKRGEEMLNQLPTLKEIPDIIKGMENAELCEIGSDSENGDGDVTKSSDDANKKRILTGVKVKLSSGKECFVSGQMVHTDDGDVFVPGQTVESEHGVEYAPGITINLDNQPTLISGLIMGEEEKPPMFLPTQSTITADGQLTFAVVPEERPQPDPVKVEQRKKKRRERKLREMRKNNPEKPLEDEAVNDANMINENTLNGFDQNFFQVFILQDGEEEEDISESSDDTEDKSSIELNNSDIEELDIEAIRRKQEQQRLELERLKQILLDDGMDDVIANIEDKKAKLKQKLEELRKLSICRDNLVTYAGETDALEIASKVSENKETINRVVDILLTLTRRASTFRDRNSINADNINQPCTIDEDLTETDMTLNSSSNKLKTLLKTAIVAANEVFKNRPKDQVLALNVMSEIIVEVLKKDGTVLEELLKITQTPIERMEICNSIYRQLTQNIAKSKMSMLKDIQDSNISEFELENLIEKVLDKEGDILPSSFSKVVKADDKTKQLLLKNIKQQSKKVTNEKRAVEVLKSSITNTIKSACEENLNDFANTCSEEQMSDFLNEAKSFAQALDLDKVQEELSKMKLKQAVKQQLYSKQTTELLKRIILMRQLAEKDYSLKTAIGRIKKDPERAKSDPRIRQLIRESAVLISEASPLKSSRDIPLKIMKKQNMLVLEDFLMQRSGVEYPVLINRGELQTVLPKESARSVLAGRVPYVLIDESGVTNFKPMHMLSAIKVNQNREKRYEDYLSYGKRDRSSDRADDKSYLQAKSNVRRLKKLLDNRRSVA